MLAASALIAALARGILHTFLGDFFSLQSGTNIMSLLAIALLVLLLMVFLLWVTGFCAESAHEPLPVGETG